MTDIPRRKGSRFCKHTRGHCRHLIETEENSLPVLSEFPVGKKCKVVSLMGCVMNKRLANMGLGVGSIIEIIKNDLSGGPLIVFSDSVRIAIGRGMARQICCEEIEDE